ncbi:MAG: uroporphyrinogen decarboxylase [Chloroflexi bacterium]|nr:MAG: uroporphyrinogen decarboxylase [Chloroflexota bacterium]
MENTPEPTAPFLRACRRLLTDYTPIWLMRQAGRYMPEYRVLQEKYSMMERVNTPELAAEITMQPIDAFNLDAAIIFSDILPPLMGMGLNLEFIDGVGPCLHNPINSAQAVAELLTPPAAEIMEPTLQAIKLATAELAPRNIPLIGFSGAPFTLACYAIEGGGSKNYLKAKAFMYNKPVAWDMLMNKLVAVQADYLLAQVQAGAAALQVFDSWAGHVLSKLDYLRYVRPYNIALYKKLAQANVPIINFSTGTSSYLAEVAACGGDVMGVDWQMPLDWAWQQIGYDKAIQGNLDPVALLAPWPELKARIDAVLDGVNGRFGHIFNLGHGLFPTAPVDTVRRLVDYVHEHTLAISK